jgi:hypothetical protein
MRRFSASTVLTFALLGGLPSHATTMDLTNCPTTGADSCTDNGMTIDLIGYSSWNSDTAFGMALGDAYLVTDLGVVGGADFFLAGGGLFIAHSFRFQHGHGVDINGNGPYVSIWEGFREGASVASQSIDGFTRDGPTFVDVSLTSFAGIALDFLSVRMGQSAGGEDMGIGGLDFSVAPVPMPATLPMLVSALGAGGLAGWWRRERHASRRV